MTKLTGLNQVFDAFKNDLAPTAKQSETISKRRDTVRSYIEADWNVRDVLIGGSHGRGTKVRASAGPSDVDLYLVLDDSHRSSYDGFWAMKSPTDLLDDVRKTLGKQLTTPKVRKDSPAIRITYEDLLVDVVPTFRRTWGGLDMPSPGGFLNSGWKITTPEQQADAFAELHRQRGYRLKPLIRMAKYWLAQRSFAMRSYHLESLAYEAFRHVELTSYREGIAYLFEDAANRVMYTVNDPGGSGSQVCDYMDWQKRSAAAAAMRSAGAAARAAIGAPTYAQEAVLWKSLLGPRFPSMS